MVGLLLFILLFICLALGLGLFVFSAIVLVDVAIRLYENKIVPWLDEHIGEA